MIAETDLAILLRELTPLLNEGEYVYCTSNERDHACRQEAIGMFREKEGVTFIINKSLADELGISYGQIWSWITLTVHSSLEAVGLTAVFSTALADEEISCNVVAGFYHDHIFVPQKDSAKAMKALQRLKG